MFATRTMTTVGGVVLGRDGRIEALVVGIPHPAASGRLRYAAHVDHGFSPVPQQVGT
jgi:hypothetical protein